MIRYTTAVVPPALEQLGISEATWLETPKPSQAVLLMQLMQLDVLLEKVQVLEEKIDPSLVFTPTRYRGGRPKKQR